ncbi:MAG TPA: hypothetical protein VH968_10710, partial [Gaiellaceae bacterium]
MKLRLAIPALAVALCFAAASVAPTALASPAQASKKKGGGKKKKAKSKVYMVCKHGCKFRTIQRAVNAAGSFKHKRKNRKVTTIVKVKPGKYVEGVVVEGK